MEDHQEHYIHMNILKWQVEVEEEDMINLEQLFI